MSLVKKFATVASGTLMSRALGFGREMLMAAALGTGPVADAFNAAFQFPNTFRRLFAEGAFNAAFVPLFAKEIETHGTDGAKRFSEEVFGVLFTALLALTIAMELAMPLIVRYLVAPGFASTPGKFDMTVALATITSPARAITPILPTCAVPHRAQQQRQPGHRHLACRIKTVTVLRWYGLLRPSVRAHRTSRCAIAASR